jgi:TP901 family phage tail tape measure protein
MNNLLKIAIMLTAYDQMSREIQAAVGKSKKELTDLKNHARSEFASGVGLIGAGMVGVNAIVKTEQAFADLDEAAKNLQSTMTRDGGIMDTKQFEASTKLAKDLSDYLPGTTADILNMFNTMEQTGISADSVLNGVGKSAAYLAVAIKMPYDEAGKFAAKMKEATGIADNEMIKFMDTIARTRQLGVDASEMGFAFARSAGSLKLLGIQGLAAAKSTSALYAMLVKTGASGETIGTGMTSIFNSITNPEKVNAFNDALRKYGIQVDFVDKKTGKFKGVENLMVQFDKIKKLGLGVEEQGALTRMLLGPGADANFMNILVSKGVAGFNEMTDAMSRQATLDEKVNIQMSSLKNQWEALTGTATNFLATMGAALAPTLIKIFTILGKILAATTAFFEANPKLAKMVMLMLAVVSAGLMLMGVWKIFMILKSAMIAFNIVCAANPYVLLALAFIAIVAALIIWRAEIKKFFSNNPLLRIAAILLAPLMLIVVYWNEIISFFSGLPNRIMNLGSRFYNAGKNIVKSIWEGVKSMANKPVEAIAGIVQKVRDFLPFSPAKTGPFKDLHKVKIIETIAGAMRPGPMVNAMSKAVGLSSTAGGGRSLGANSGRGAGGITIHYAPVVTLGVGANKEDFVKLLRDNADELMRMIKNAGAKMERGKY